MIIKGGLEPEALDEISLKMDHIMVASHIFVFSQVIGHNLNRVPSCVVLEGVPGLELEAVDEASLKVGQSMEISKENDSQKS